jgi:type VI secretion system protein VasJ
MLRMRFDDLAAAENWLGLIHDADTAAAEHVFWLDPHRYIASAMDRLGPSYEPAKKAVIWELALLLRRAPGFQELTFNDGTPFADAATQAWIESEVLPALGSAAGGGGPISPLDAAIREARGLLGSAKLPEAIAVLAKASAGAPSLAQRFRGKLAMAELCIQAEQFAIARAQLEGLERVAEQYRLAEWDPELCAALYSALYVAQRSANRLLGHEVTPEAVQREIAIFDRLCQFDAAAAVKLTSS